MMNGLLFHVSGVSAVSAGCADPALWQSWAHEGGTQAPVGAAPDFSCIPASIRRRLSLMGRCALAAYAALAPEEGEPAVWASSWGDISRTFKLTGALSEDGDMSPADFALSVHNGIGAQAAIWKKNHTACPAIAAGPVTGSCALIEAALLLQQSPSVIVVRCEEPLPELWSGTTLTDSAMEPCAWAARFTLAPSENVFTLTPVQGVEAGACGGIFDEIRFLLGASSRCEQTDGVQAWRWAKP